MNGRISRRDVLGALGAGLLIPGIASRASPPAPLFKLRTITAGVNLGSVTDFEAIDAAFAFLTEARNSYVTAGYEVQTIRIATQPLREYLPQWGAPDAIGHLRKLDERATAGRASFSIGPVLTADESAPEFARWAAELTQATTNTFFSAFAASASHGVHYRAARAAAEAIAAIASATSGGEGNFRFAATAFCPPGTPFVPAAFHVGKPAFSIGLESPRLLQAAFTRAPDLPTAKTALRLSMNAALAPVQSLAQDIARETGRRFLGIDVSPAPFKDASIGQAVETLTGVPFGEPQTLAACAAITEVLKSVDVRTCGYSGLMLPVLEDPVLARRAGEGRYGVAELLLYSSVCGTGLDVIPLPGDSEVTKLAATIVDMAALATRYQKPLSARLIPLPGKKAGDLATFDNPYLVDSVVMPLGTSGRGV